MITAAFISPPEDMSTDRTPPKPDDPAAPSKAMATDIHRIVLTGFMGSGKTTAGSLLAGLLSWSFVDLDREIERRDGRSIPEIFAASGSNGGEAYFRRLETSLLAAVLGRRKIVLALGGGAPERLGNRLLLEQTPRTKVVFLAAPFHVLTRRCDNQAQDPTSTARPVLADLRVAEKRFQLRRAHYERIASHIVDTSDLTPAQTASSILDLLSPKL